MGFRFQQMELRMHRYFKTDENIMRVKEYLAECSVGDWFVLYQMSKNMNKRLFFVFLSNLSKVPRKQILQCLVPQIKAVNAFKRSLKKKSVKNGTGLDSVDEKENSPETKRKDRKCDDDIDYEDEHTSAIKKRSFIKTTEEDKNERTALAFQNTFGKIRKSKT